MRNLSKPVSDVQTIEFIGNCVIYLDSDELIEIRYYVIKLDNAYGLRLEKYQDGDCVETEDGLLHERSYDDVVSCARRCQLCAVTPMGLSDYIAVMGN